jgi:predicted O-methyltransferase YrrM
MTNVDERSYIITETSALELGTAFCYSSLAIIRGAGIPAAYTFIK